MEYHKNMLNIGIFPKPEEKRLNFVNVNHLNLPKSIKMKSLSKWLFMLLLAVLPLSLFAQNPTVILEYMKVPQGMEDEYLEVEQAWKKIHEKRIEAGICAGWQLWRNVYAGYNDPYQYITINWYNSYGETFEQGNWPEGITEGLFTDEEWNKIWAMTAESRVLAHRDVSHQLLTADNNAGGNLIQLNHMKVKQGKESEYLKMEQEIFKPMQEEAIRRGMKSHWGVWAIWPYSKGQERYLTVDGFKDATQFTGEGEDLLQAVHPGKTWDEINEMVDRTRTISSVEVWELVDSAFPEGE
jgi:hypothetical protein